MATRHTSTCVPLPTRSTRGKTSFRRSNSRGACGQPVADALRGSAPVGRRGGVLDAPLRGMRRGGPGPQPAAAAAGCGAEGLVTPAPVYPLHHHQLGGRCAARTSCAAAGHSRSSRQCQHSSITLLGGWPRRLGRQRRTGAGTSGVSGASASAAATAGFIISVASSHAAARAGQTLQLGALELAEACGAAEHADVLLLSAVPQEVLMVGQLTCATPAATTAAADGHLLPVSVCAGGGGASPRTGVAWPIAIAHCL